LLGQVCVRLSDRAAREIDGMSVVYEAIEDCVGDGWIADVLVPLADGELASEDSRSIAVAVLEDLEDIAALLFAHGRDAPVVDNEQVHLGKASQQLGVRAIGTGHQEFLEQSWHAAVDSG